MENNFVPDGHLSSLFLKWKRDPELWGEEMAKTVDSIIYYSLKRQSLHPVFRKYEDDEDLIQELRLLCFERLHKVQNPTNKRLFNYLQVSIRLGLMDKTRRVGKLMDRDRIISNVAPGKTMEPDFSNDYFNFGNTLTNQVATLLSEGYSKSKIKKMLKVSSNKMAEIIKELKSIYEKK